MILPIAVDPSKCRHSLLERYCEAPCPAAYQQGLLRRCCRCGESKWELVLWENLDPCVASVRIVDLMAGRVLVVGGSFRQMAQSERWRT